MAATSRRTFLAGTAALTGASTAVVAPSLASRAPELDRLWTALLAAYGQGVVISREVARAEALLPWWAVTGPIYLVAEGEPEHKARSGCPAIQGMDRPLPGTFRLIRPSPRDIERDYARAVDYWGDKSGQAKAGFDRRMTEFNERREAQSTERAKVGLPEIDAREEANATTINDLERAIEALPGSLDVTAALVMLATVRNALRHHCFDCGDEEAGFVALTGLRPFVTGAVAATVADFLDNPERPFCWSPLWGSYWPADRNPEAEA